MNDKVNEEYNIDKDNNNDKMIISSYTWNRDSHGLFDYEAKDSGIKRQTFENVNYPCIVTRRLNEIKIRSENFNIENKEEEFLLKISSSSKGEDSYFPIIEANLEYNQEAIEKNINNLQYKAWYLISPLKPKQEGDNLINMNRNEAYKLRVNDIIKLGRVKYFITEIMLNGNIIKYENYPSNPIFQLIFKNDININIDNKECKICLSGHNNDPFDPLVNLCKCTGSMICLHYLCLKHWLNTKLTTKLDLMVNSYNMKSFNCEICKTPYPCKFLIMTF